MKKVFIDFLQKPMSEKRKEHYKVKILFVVKLQPDLEPNLNELEQT